jgi:porin
MDLTHESDPDQGLKGWVRAGVAEDTVFAISRYLGGGLNYAGLLPGRDHDLAGIAVMRAGFGAPYRDAEGAGVSETTVELTYQAEIRSGLIVQPDIQYVVHPSGDPSVRDALVVGVRLRVGLSALSGE